MAPMLEQPAAPKLPAASDFNAIYNRISLASAKQNTFLNSMRAKYPSLARSSASRSTSSAPATDITDGTVKFSSLKKPPTSSTISSTTSSTRTRVAAEDDSDLRFENPNTGLGYAPPKFEKKASAATRDLSRRLLGKRDREVEKNVATQKRRVQAEESEEEEGRSGLGREKKRARTKEVDSFDVEVEDARPVAVENREGRNAQAEISEANYEASPVEPQPEAAEDDVATTWAAKTETGEAKKKKKKKNKKKMMAHGIAKV